MCDPIRRNHIQVYKQVSRTHTNVFSYNYDYKLYIPKYNI